MKIIELRTLEFRQRGPKAWLVAGTAAFLCTAASAWATLSPLPMLCIDGTIPVVTYSDLSEITVGGVSAPTITYGDEYANIQFYTSPVFLNDYGTFSVILTQGGTPSEVVT